MRAHAPDSGRQRHPGTYQIKALGVVAVDDQLQVIGDRDLSGARLLTGSFRLGRPQPDVEGRHEEDKDGRGDNEQMAVAKAAPGNIKKAQTERDHQREGDTGEPPVCKHLPHTGGERRQHGAGFSYLALVEYFPEEPVPAGQLSTAKAAAVCQPPRLNSAKSTIYVLFHRLITVQFAQKSISGAYDRVSASGHFSTRA